MVSNFKYIYIKCSGVCYNIFVLLYKYIKHKYVIKIYLRL